MTHSKSQNKRHCAGSRPDCKDKALWEWYTRDITPLDPGGAQNISSSDSADSGDTPQISVEKPGMQTELPEDHTTYHVPHYAAGIGGDRRHLRAQPRDVDRATKARLRRGRLPIEARLDLHGMRRHEAQTALADFLKRCRRRKIRCVLVITGKGGPPDLESMEAPAGRGVLRRSVPQWLAEPPLNEIVLSHAPARPVHGGDGALYVLLRRRRGRA